MKMGDEVSDGFNTVPEFCDKCGKVMDHILTKNIDYSLFDVDAIEHLSGVPPKDQQFPKTAALFECSSCVVRPSSEGTPEKMHRQVRIVEGMVSNKASP